MDCAIQNTWKWQFFSFSPLFTLMFLYFFSTRKKSNAFVYTKYSFTACDRHRQPFECSREEKKNLIVVFFYSFTASMDLFTRWGHRTFILLNEKKNVSWTNTEIDGNEVKQFWLFFQLNEEWLYFGWRTLIWLWLSTIGSPYFDFFKWFSSCKYSHVNSINIFKDHLRIH